MVVENWVIEAVGEVSVCLTLNLMKRLFYQLSNKRNPLTDLPSSLMRDLRS
jgi:hypothetical protein